MKIISVFSHKGGVGKTTSVYNIGWMLSKKYRVLLVDGDSQCNLTQMFLGDEFDSYYTDESTKGQNIKTGVDPALYARPEAIKPVSCPKSPHKDNLFLMAGNYELSELENSLTLAMIADVPTLFNLPGALYQLISKSAEQINIDYVLIDMNPSLSMINRNLFLMSDAFIIPTSPDTFSKRALESLAKHLPAWATKWEEKKSAFVDAQYRLPDAQRKFIGQVPQRFNIRNGKATKAFSEMIEDLKNEANSSLAPALKAVNMLFADEEYAQANVNTSGFVIAEIPNFNTLAAKGQRDSMPAYATANVGQGVVRTNTLRQQDMQANCYKTIVSAITQLLPVQ